MTELNEPTIIKNALASREANISKERKEKVVNMIMRGNELVGTEYHLGGTLEEDNKGIDCSHFVAYCMELPNWQKENTWKLDDKYRETEVPIEDAKPGDLLMRPWHYDPDVKREIGHVEIVIGKTLDGKLVTLGATGISNPINKYTAEGKKLPKHNCVGYTVREPKEGMRILRA